MEAYSKSFYKCDLYTDISVLKIEEALNSVDTTLTDMMLKILKSTNSYSDTMLLENVIYYIRDNVNYLNYKILVNEQ